METYACKTRQKIEQHLFFFFLDKEGERETLGERCRMPECESLERRIESPIFGIKRQKNITFCMVEVISCLFRVDVGRVNSLEGGDGDVGDVGVQLVDAVLVLVALAGESDANPDRDTFDTLGPKMFVEAGVDTNVLRAHLLLREVTDRLDSSWRAFLGTDAENALVHMDGVFARHDLVDRALSLLLGFLRGWRHLHLNTVFRFYLQKNPEI